jgi:V8-like Glu-specific endopeptidase
MRGQGSKSLLRTICLVLGTTMTLAGIGARSAFAQGFQSSSEYWKDETRRELKDTIERAKKGLQILDKPSTQLRQPRSSQAPSPMEPRISNGVGTFRYPATGALLKGESAPSAKLYCTGTLIACDKFLVAAHCVVEDPDPGQYHVYFQVGGIIGVKKVEWPAENYQYPEATADIAIVTLEKSVEGIAPERLSTLGKTPYKTQGTIVGFGRTGGDRLDYGLKREGYVQTARCATGLPDDQLVCWNFSALTQNGARRSDTCNADSGGPLFVISELESRPTQLVAGVTGGGDASSNCLLGDHAYDTGVFQNRKWLQQVGIAEIPPGSCGVPNVDVGRDVVGATFTLNDTDTKQVVRQIDVGSNVTKLMVAMNAEDSGYGANDFDLYVIQGTEPNIEKAVCKEDGSGQFAFCSIPAPKPGKWTILARRKSGTGMGQIVVTKVTDTVR